MRDIAKPIPARNEVLIKVVAATITSADWRARSLDVTSGFGLLARLAFGITGPRQPSLGTELAGIIEATGEDVTRFKPGDEVIAFTGLKYGCHVEHKAVPEDRMVVTIPPTSRSSKRQLWPLAAGRRYTFCRRRAAQKG